MQRWWLAVGVVLLSAGSAAAQPGGAIGALEGRARDNALSGDEVRLRQDDSLAKVAYRFQVAPEELTRLNPAVTPRVGARLRLPAHRKLPSAQRAEGDVSNPERWLRHARSQIGQREVAGARDNPRIRAYHRVASGVEARDELEWCAAFMNWVMEQAGLPRTRSDWARDWLDLGTPLAEPRPGAIVVFTRGTSSDSGHVAIYLGPGGPGKIRVLGGNQGNSVCEAEYPRAQVLGYRWPR